MSGAFDLSGVGSRIVFIFTTACPEETLPCDHQNWPFASGWGQSHCVLPSSSLDDFGHVWHLLPYAAGLHFVQLHRYDLWLVSFACDHFMDGTLSCVRSFCHHHVVFFDALLSSSSAHLPQQEQTLTRRSFPLQRDFHKLVWSMMATCPCAIKRLWSLGLARVDTTFHVVLSPGALWSRTAFLQQFGWYFREHLVVPIVIYLKRKMVI